MFCVILAISVVREPMTQFACIMYRWESSTEDGENGVRRNTFSTDFCHYYWWQDWSQTGLSLGLILLVLVLQHWSWS